MYDNIRRRIEQRISRAPRFSVERIARGDLDAEGNSSLISEHVSSQLERQMTEMYDDTDATEAAAQRRDTTRRFGSLQTRTQLEKHLVEQVSVEIGGPRTAFKFTLPSNSKVFGPPYDLEWSEGNGLAFGGRIDGKGITLPKANGFSAAGIGFYLTTSEPVLAAITPQGTYDWNWAAFADLPFVRSRGGMGIAIYTDSSPKPTMSRQPVLWSVSGMTMLSGQKGSGQIAAAASPAFGLGTVPLAPALLNMVPGSRYLVWVWCWQTSQGEEAGSIAFLQFRMPFVTIDAGPPIFIH